MFCFLMVKFAPTSKLPFVPTSNLAKGPFWRKMVFNDAQSALQGQRRSLSSTGKSDCSTGPTVSFMSSSSTAVIEPRLTQGLAQRWARYLFRIIFKSPVYVHLRFLSVERWKGALLKAQKAGGTHRAERALSHSSKIIAGGGT